MVLQQPRDVIEFPIEGEIDAGGWDLRKALLLALSGNAVVIEWAKSPIIYEEVPGFRERLTGLLDRIVLPSKLARHYLGLARAHFARTESLSCDVKLKKLFYFIRPIMALDWMEQRAFSALPPMNLPECMAGVHMREDARQQILTLIKSKSVTREMGTGPVPSAIASFLAERYAVHTRDVPGLATGRQDQEQAYELAERFYREVVLP